MTKLEAQYEDPDNKLSLTTTTHLIHPLSLPLTTISFSRRLFHSEPQRGKIVLQASKHPTISFQYYSPPTIKLEEGDALPQQSPPTSSGLKYVLLDKTIGITIDQIIPSLVAEIGLTLVELSVRFKCSVQLGLAGVLLNLGAGWSNDTTEVGSIVTLSPAAAKLQFELVILLFYYPILFTHGF